jgi:hypothetical protein
VIVSSVPVSAGHRYIPTFSEAVIAIRSTAAYDKVKTPLVGGRLNTLGLRHLGICLSMNCGAIRLIAFNTLLRPGRISSLPASMPEIARLASR